MKFVEKTQKKKKYGRTSEGEKKKNKSRQPSVVKKKKGLIDRSSMHRNTDTHTHTEKKKNERRVHRAVPFTRFAKAYNLTITNVI